MRAFIYSRVSTVEQNPGMQVAELEEYVAKRGWSIVGRFSDVTTGQKSKRPELDKMLVRARRRECDVVVVYKLDRFARSLLFLVNTLEEFEALGLKLVSIHDDFDFTTPMGRLMFHIVSAFAEFERDLLRERTVSGLAHARAQGKRIGRPGAVVDLALIRQLRAQGTPWRDISRGVGLGMSTLRRLCSKTPRNGTQLTN